jgi:hypothetical protein
MLKKIHVIKLLISKANNFEAIINKDRVTFPPKCFGGGGGFANHHHKRERNFQNCSPNLHSSLPPLEFIAVSRVECLNPISLVKFEILIIYVMGCVCACM